MTVAVGVDVYADRAEADAYFAVRGVTAWSDADEAARDAALVRATGWLEGHYRWVGRLVDPSQPLAWPRAGARDSEGRVVDGIPDRVKAACAELALIALTQDLAPPLERGGRVLSERVGSVEISYAAEAPAGRSFPAVDALLRGLTRPTENGVPVRRA
ncbi:DnaT-like ssDNA-binding protein [Thalassobaculum sp.]|uniref:DnaT-like ssDNA-binding protein n=1 Tax=Thalassobaculum sp. TaxID=2022740 RepID=UPI0032EA9DDB